MSNFTQSGRNYQPNTPTQIKRIKESRPPTTNDYRNFFPGDEWLDDDGQDWWKFVERTAPTSGLWVKIGGTSAVVETFTVDASSAPGTNPVVPNASNDVTVTGAQVASGVVGANVIRTDSLTANTYTIEIQRSADSAAADSTLNGVSHFDNTQFTVDSDAFVQLVGGAGPALQSVNVDTSSAPGTDPVVPDGSGQITVTGAQVASGIIGTNVIRTDSLAANTYTIEIQRTTTSVGSDAAVNGISHFDSAAFQVDSAGFVQLAGGGTATESYIPDTGTSPVVPDATGQLSVLGQATPNTSGIQVTGGTNVLNIAMFSPFVGDFTFTDSTAAATETLTVSNTDNTGASDSGAQLAVNVGGTTQVGDPYVSIGTGSSRAYSLGSDTSDSQILKMTTNNAATVTPSSGTEIWTMTAAGIRNLPEQPTFYAVVSMDQTNATGNGAVYGIVADSVSYSQGTGYNSGTGVYTLPRTGVYIVSITVSLVPLTAAMTLGALGFSINSGAPQNVPLHNPSVVRDVNDRALYVSTIYFQGSAGTTIQPAITISNGAGNTVTVESGNTYFWSMLIM